MTLGAPTPEELASLEALAREATDLWRTADEDILASSDAIRVVAGELHEMATRGERALIDAGAPFYSRGEAIVRPVVDEMPATHGRMSKVPRLRKVDRDMMVDHLSRSAAWVKFNVRKRAWIACDPPAPVALTILSRDGEWGFPKLAGVITTPTLRPDGTILSEAGYDPATRLLLLDPPALPEISKRPTKQDAQAALAELNALLDEFPFVDEASRSVALSALITPVVRGAMPVAPLHVTTAPTAGTGKSYIFDIASAINGGQPAPVIAAGRTEEETEKRLVAALLGGQAIVSIDNVNGQLGGDFLCQMIERPVVTPRILGHSKNERIESRATCFATGNNIHLVGDMTRRVIMCSLDANMERPELREFKARPFDVVLADRGKYIAAALTVARAYIVAGCPDPQPALASFEDWSRIVRSALVWLGCEDPVSTMEAARADDPITVNLRAVYSAWHDSVGASARSTGQMKELAEERNPLGNMTHGELHRALCEAAEKRPGEIDSRRLGHFLGRHKGRIVDGLKLQDSEDRHSSQKLWSVVRVP
jgi:putative DNA primase/helicase